jgi:aarF domain-containing kinase
MGDGLGTRLSNDNEWEEQRIILPELIYNAITASNANADLLAATLCHMRGARGRLENGKNNVEHSRRMKSSLLPPALTRAFDKVRQGAEAMPHIYQLIQHNSNHLNLVRIGERYKFETFEERPFAAASIGQVHRGTMRQKRDGTTMIQDVVIQVQYPGVSREFH